MARRRADVEEGTEAELLQLAQRGDHGAFERVIAHYATPAAEPNRPRGKTRR